MLQVKKTVSLLLFLISTSMGYAQNLDFIIRTNLGIGAEYETLDYNTGDLYYSPGGGMGAEVGLQVEVAENFSLQSTIGYQLNLALLAESTNGVSNKSSFLFNRKFISFGAFSKIPFSNNLVNSLLVGGGIHYNMPGRMERIENDIDLGISRYNTGIGYYVDLSLRLKVSKRVFLDPGIRYRRLSLDAKSYSEGDISDLPIYLQTLNTNGIELGFAIVRRI